MSRFRTFLEMHKIFYMVERTFDGNTFIDMIIDDPKLRELLLNENYNTLDYGSGVKELTVMNSYDTSKYMKPIVTIPTGRSTSCLRIVCDDHYASKINKASHIIMNYH